MKETPQDKSLEERMGASKFSGEGFLGTDHRPVDEIVADDLRTLERLGVPPEKLLAALRDAFEKARAALGCDVIVRQGVTACAHESRGAIPSPFRGDGVFEKGEVVVADSASGEQLVLTSLGLALIEKHGFFQGRGSRYRIDPAAAVRLLGLA